MSRVTASEFARNFGRYREVALLEPVVVTNHDRVTGVLLSPADFDEYQRLKALATRALFAGELSDEALAGIGTATVDERHRGLDRLMDEDA